jgi:hypothetical protein
MKSQNDTQEFRDQLESRWLHSILPDDYLDSFLTRPFVRGGVVVFCCRDRKHLNATKLDTYFILLRHHVGRAIRWSCPEYDAADGVHIEELSFLRD